MKFILKQFKYIFYFIVFIILVFLLSLIIFQLFVDKEKLITNIIKNIENKTDLNIDYTSAEFFLLPIPGIKVHDLKIIDSNFAIIDVKNAELYFSILKLLYGELEIFKLELSEGVINITRNKDGSIEFLEPFIEKDIQNNSINLKPSFFISIIPNYMKINQLNIHFDDLASKKKLNFNIQESSLFVNEIIGSLEFKFNGKINDRKIDIISNFSFLKDNFEFENLNYQANIQLEEFSLQLLHDILIIFPYADFSKAEITGSLLINKSDEWKSSIQVNYAKIRNIYNKKSNRIIDADVSTEIEIDVKLKKIAFNKIYGYWDNKVKTTGNGYLTFTSNPEINFNANADYIDLEPLIDIIELWIDADLEKSIYFRDLPDTGYSKRYSLSLDIKSKEVIYHKKKLNELSIHIYYKYPRININNLNFFIYGGKVESNGEIYVDHDPAKVYFGGKLENYDVEILLKNFTDNQYLRGTMYGDFKLLSNGNNQDAIINNMIIDGNLVLSKGELIGYLNILRPVASIGKIINLSNPTNDSLSFEYIRINYQYKNNNVFLKNLIMKGVGLDAIGEGRISTAGDMDVKITLALSGVAGKAIKLPIIYKGIFGKSLPYVDPIWLGSVYVGTIFLAGPAGATVGGIAGSAVSGVINKLYSNIKSIIGSKDKE